MRTENFTNNDLNIIDNEINKLVSYRNKELRKWIIYSLILNTLVETIKLYKTSTFDIYRLFLSILFSIVIFSFIWITNIVSNNYLRKLKKDRKIKQKIISKSEIKQIEKNHHEIFLKNSDRIFINEIEKYHEGDIIEYEKAEKSNYVLYIKIIEEKKPKFILKNNEILNEQTLKSKIIDTLVLVLLISIQIIAIIGGFLHLINVI